MKATLRSQQNLLDIALQECGAMEHVMEIASTAGASVTDDLPSGTELEIPVAGKERAVETFKTMNHMPATAIAGNVQSDEGIEFWAIEMDFIVS